MGTIFTLISPSAELRDLEPANVTRDLVVAARTTPRADASRPALVRKSPVRRWRRRAAVGREDASALGAAERLLLLDRLNRVADTRPGGLPAGS